MDAAPEWQFIGDDQWIFGVKVRGLVRTRLAEVYFDEDRDGGDGGWVWMVHRGGPRGVAINLASAVADAELAMEIWDGPSDLTSPADAG